ncbi:MAG: hypothetical protein RR614_01955, partial [Eubacterium sp.]
MGTEDTALKQFLSDNRRFAEVFNQAFFGGETVVEPEKLKALDSTASEIIPLRGGATKTIQKSRDIAKLYDNEIELVILGIENQKQIHYAMPLRVLMYDTLSYEHQCKTIGTTHQREKDLKGAEWTSRFSKTDKLIPVFSLVMYYGLEPWDGPKDLKSMLDIPEKFSTLDPFIGNYPMHLFEVNAIDHLENYTDDLMALFAFIKYQKERTKLVDVIEKHKDYFSHLSESTYSAIKNVVDISEIDAHIQNEKTLKGEINMCDALKEIRDEGVQQGV